MIRDAAHEDIPALLEMGERFADAAGLRDTIGYDRETVAGLFAHLIDNEDGILLIGDGGAVGGLVHASMFNAAHRTGQELFWWVDPDKRGRGIALLRALEGAAQSRGAQSWMVSTMEALNFDGAGKLYERMGYRPADRNYIKTFGG